MEACVSVEEAEETVEWYKKEKDTECYYEEKDKISYLQDIR